MTAAWPVPTVDDVKRFMSSVVLSGAGVEAATGYGRLQPVLDAVVVDVRAAVASSNRVALSATPGSVPPQAFKHALVMTAAAVASSTPQVAEWAMSPKFQSMLDAAQKWMDEAGTGLNATAPMDPDPATAPIGVVGGSASAFADMVTDP